MLLQFGPPQTLNAVFVAFLPVDMGNLSELALIAGAPGSDYSNESATGFTFTRDGITIDVTGSGFTYTGGVPDAGGMLTHVDVNQPTHEAYFFDSLDVNFSVFASGNARTIASMLLHGNDRIFGSAFGGTYYGFGGGDKLIEAGGPDNNVIYGGAGNDTLIAGGGNDRLYGGPGNDLLVAGSGNDYLNGGTGNNTAFFSQSFFTVSVTLNGNNPVIAHVGFNGHDTLVNIQNLMGGLAPDRFVGDSRNNLLVGGMGNDTLSGGAGNDTLDGGHSTDALIGNVLTGGPGRDVFLFDTPYIHSQFALNFNTITDFQRGVDKVWLDTNTFVGFTNSNGHLSAADFIAGPHVTEFNETQPNQIGYNTSTGDLYFGVYGRIAHFDHHPHLHASDFAAITETLPLGLDFIF